MRYLLLFFLLVPLTVSAGSITVYKGEAFQGKRMTLRDDVRNFSDYPGWNDSIMSAVIHGGLWEACVDAYYQNCVLLEGGDIRDFHRMGMEMKISSLREVDPRRYMRDSYYDNRYEDHHGRDDAFDDRGYGYGGRGRDMPHHIYLDDMPHRERQEGDNIRWNTPRYGSSGGSFLSSCQQIVHDGLMERFGNVEPIWFNGAPDDGRVTAKGGLAFRYRCRGDTVNVWE